jgi:hypothetical protein
MASAGLVANFQAASVGHVDAGLAVLGFVVSL